jgi:hypothetical protein
MNTLTLCSKSTYANLQRIGGVYSLLRFQRMAKKDLAKFSMPARIIFGVVAVLMIVWLLRLSGIV